MTRRIHSVLIQTIDENNHWKIWKKSDIDIDSLKFKIDQQKEKKPEPKIVTKPEPKKETTPKKSKKK